MKACRMSRRLPPRLAAALLATALLAGCDIFSGISRGPDPAVQGAAVSPRDQVRGTGYAGTGGNWPSNYRAPQGGEARDQAAVIEACRRDMDRVISTRDRGQIMREDEAANRQGADTMAYSPFSLRMQTDQMGRAFERDRLVRECIQRNDRSSTPGPGAAPGASRAPSISTSPR